jgi:colanic acid/amylovoran biosynthesis glycosyltransferase
MNIVFVNGRFPQVSQTFVLNHIDHATATGHRTIVTAAQLVRGIDDPIVEKLGLDDKIIYGSPKDSTLCARVIAAAFRRPQFLWKALRRGTRRQHSLETTLIAMQIGIVPDVLVAHFGPNGLMAAALKQHFFPAAKVVVIFHGYDVSAYVRRKGWHPYRQMAPWIDLAVCVNAQWAKLISENTQIGKIVVHHLGVRWKGFPTWRPRREKDYSVLFVGRMTEKKGFDQLLLAVDKLKRRGRRVRVDAVGGGTLLARFRAMAEDLDLGGSVAFHGARDHRFVLDLMSESDCLVAPSITGSNGDQEGIPVVLMEAMGCGLPVVATKHSGIPELVVDGESGLLVEERNAEELANRIERLMLEPDLARALAAAGRRRVAEHFDAEQQDRALFAMIELLLRPEQTSPGGAA